MLKTQIFYDGARCCKVSQSSASHILFAKVPPVQMYWAQDYHLKWKAMTGENGETLYAMHLVQNDGEVVEKTPFSKRPNQVVNEMFHLVTARISKVFSAFVMTSSKVFLTSTGRLTAIE